MPEFDTPAEWQSHLRFGDSVVQLYYGCVDVKHHVYFAVPAQDGHLDFHTARPELDSAATSRAPNRNFK